MDETESLREQRQRAARLAVPPSATRNQGGPGIVEASRDFLSGLDTAPFSKGDCEGVRRALGEATNELESALREKGRRWGLARKLLDIFLRDALYRAILRRPSDLAWVDTCLVEMPRDSITAGRIKEETPPRSLPAWPGGEEPRRSPERSLSGCCLSHRS